MSVRIDVRPMTDAEQRAARLLLPNEPRALDVIAARMAEVAGVGCAVPIAVSFLVWLASAVGATLDDKMVVRMVVTFLVLGVTWTIAEGWRELGAVRARRQQIAGDLAGDVVEVVSVEAEAILSAPREGAIDWILADVGGGEAVFVSGPHLDELFATERAVFRRFELVRLPGSRATLGVVVLGDPGEPGPFDARVERLEDGAVVKLDDVRRP